MIDYPPSYPTAWHGAGPYGMSARGFKGKSWPRRFADFLATQTELLRGDEFLIAVPARRAMPQANPGAARQR